MAEFKTGQWVICDGKYMQVMGKYYRRGYMTILCRRAGTQEIVGNAPKVLTLASLTPDFSNAKECDECWLYGIGDTKIDSIAKSYSSHCVRVLDDDNVYVFDRFGYMFLVTENIAEMKAATAECDLCDAPTLFNSFAQFQAYWAEIFLEMGGKS